MGDIAKEPPTEACAITTETGLNDSVRIDDRRAPELAGRRMQTLSGYIRNP
jgi:hypothetical protein